MLYNTFQDLKLSALGMGTMRLPQNGGKIDSAQVEKMVAYAMEHGVNYYDTAWGYHGGESELVMGKALSKYPRDSFYLATKFPGYDLSNMDKVEEIFEKQLEKCRVDYFDFYLMHNVNELNYRMYLDPKYRILEYLLKQKEAGRIKHFGFSAHGSCDVIRAFLEVYGPYMEFGQLQLNYLDWHFQNAAAKYALLQEKGLPVWVMEPLRGGMLAKLPEKYAKQLSALRPEESTPAWSFRFLQSLDGVVVTLSGMSDFAQMQANIETFSQARPTNEAEKQQLFAIADSMLREKILPCTACRYCVTHCPQGLDIPTLLSLYNEHHFTGGGFLAPMRLASMPPDKGPGACIGCGSCEAVCPQQLSIPETLAAFAKML